MSDSHAHGEVECDRHGLSPRPPDEQVPGVSADPVPQPGLAVHHEVAERRVEADAVLFGRANCHSGDLAPRGRVAELVP